MTPRRPGERAILAVGLAALALLALAALLAAGAGPAYRTGMLSLGNAFGMLRYGVYVAIGAGALGLIALLIAAWRRQVRPVLLGGVVLLASGALVSVPLAHLQRAQTVPPIHDITTDTESPPAFDALAEARRAAPNALAYPGEDTARQQREAYPDLGPLRLDAPLPAVRDAALAVMRDFGWDVAAAGDTRLEATATTTWFGFEDDVVVRLTQTAEGVRVDMRSASRVGRSDVGTNAARIRTFLDALAQRLEA